MILSSKGCRSRKKSELKSHIALSGIERMFHLVRDVENIRATSDRNTSDPWKFKSEKGGGLTSWGPYKNVNAIMGPALLPRPQTPIPFLPHFHLQDKLHLEGDAATSPASIPGLMQSPAFNFLEIFKYFLPLLKEICIHAIQNLIPQPIWSLHSSKILPSNRLFFSMSEFNTESVGLVLIKL